MMANTPFDMTKLVNIAAEPITSSAHSAPHNGVTYKVGTYTYNVPVKYSVTGSKQVSVKMDSSDYAMMRYVAESLDMTHRDILLEGFTLWLQANQAKLPRNLQ